MIKWDHNLSSFSEILVAGLQGAVWVAFLVATLLGAKWIDGLQLSEWGIVVGGVGLAFVYGLGVLIDRVADQLFDTRDKKIRDYVTEVEREESALWRLKIMEREENFGTDLAYMRTKVRLSRTMALNSALISVFGLLYAFVRTTAASSGRGIALLVVGGVFGFGTAVLSLWAWSRATHGQYKQLKQMHEVLFGQQSG